MASLSYNKEAEIIPAFSSSSRYLDALLYIDNLYSEGMEVESRNKVMTAKLFTQGCRYHKLSKGVLGFIGGILA